MSESYCIIPWMNHYIWIIDLIRCACYLEEDMNFIAKMHDADIILWTKVMVGYVQNGYIGDIE